MNLSLHIYHQQQPVYSTRFSGSVELGRQQADEQPCYNRVAIDGGIRIVVANQVEATFSRRHVRLEPRADGKVVVRNLSAAVPIATDSAGVVGPQDQRELTPPFVLVVGDRSMRIEPEEEDASPMVSLANVTMAPGQQRPPSTRIRAIAAAAAGDEHGETLVQWLQAAMSVFQSAASSPDFLERAAQAVVELVGLDTASVVIWDGSIWNPQNVCTRSGDVSANWQPSRTILDAARSERRTFRRATTLASAASLKGVEALVAAPILDAQGEVIGALYGDRRQPAEDRDSVDITQLEAMLVELLASGVAAGLARLEQERTALAARVRFEQFFTPELAQQLESHPDLLDGRDAEITVLFCDVRGFSRISERLGAARTFAWICDVMEEFSECIQRFNGVLVDYIGDEVIAMWGAPVETADHETLACQAALEMVKKLGVLNERWANELGEPVSIGVGVNSGMARVGNTGSTRKFKYGPLGNTVNLASRVQGATKHLKSKILITGNTAARLDAEINRRRLSRVRVVNIETPVDLYEIVATADESWCALRDRYEKALDAVERKEFFTATKHLGNLVAEYPNDGPSQLLLSRAVSALISRDDFDHVWELESK
ncbi:MAG: adenylate/guanylate cyclase domain-containing protein [Planctomycetaceae bacterium]|nr:adenylate/guanylate cyclase domain-containing protein [Planctomycetales bacterium]MCB9922174.1 adenylate/guanylate cyclase domain-containing protein [Planctomycetaceae bacterium]